MLRGLLSLVLAASLFLTFSAAGRAADWPAFRGPNNDGVSPESAVPTKWGPDDNVAWKASLPRPANGSPIVAAGRVFVTSAEDKEGKQRSLYCFDRKDGKQLWVRTVDFGKALPTHETNPYCGTTPVSDGKRVVVWHASAGLHCYDLEGKEIWSRDLGEFQHMWGYGTSPILYHDHVILHAGPGKEVFVTALDLASGSTLWQTGEPLDGDGDHNSDGKYMGSWCTPIVTRVNGKDQVIVSLPTRVNAYDPDNGEIIWSCLGLRHDGGDLAYSSPVIAGDICFVTGGFAGAAMGIRLGGTGYITDKNRLWRTEKSPQSIGSGVVVDGYVYRPNAGPGTIECLEPATGRIVWRDRASGNNHWASLVMAGSLLYATDQSGACVIFKPNPAKYDEVARNELGEGTNATPAVSDGQLFFRTAQHLICVGK